LFLTYIRDTDPDPHSFEKLDQDPHSPKKLDPDPHSQCGSEILHRAAVFTVPVAALFSSLLSFFPSCCTGYDPQQQLLTYLSAQAAVVVAALLL
jgi:hypothetical protein